MLQLHDDPTWAREIQAFLRFAISFFFQIKSSIASKQFMKVQ